MAKPKNLQKLVFLDTNVLHYIGLYLVYSAKEHLSPLDFKKALDSINKLEDENLQKGLKQGCTIVEFVLDRDMQVEYASVSELELLVGRIKGRALLNAAREGVPDRMFSRIYEEQIRQNVNTTQLSDIKAGVDNLANMLGKTGVNVLQGNSGMARDVLDLAFQINGLVYIEALDSIVYSSALLSRADYLFTSDGAFKNITNRIQKPNGDAFFEQVNVNVRKLVANFTLEKVSKVVLPSVHNFSEAGNVRPEIPKT